MDATQQIEDSFFGEEDVSDDEHGLGEEKRQREPLAVLKVLKNNHIPETEVPLYQGENVLGRDPASCPVPLQARSISSRHAIISISVFGPNDRHARSEATEALLWDLGSLNGTRKGQLKLTPQVRYALTEGDGVVLADLPCQYISLKNTERNTHTSTADGGREKAKGPTRTSSSSEGGTGKGVENGGKKSALPPVPVWTDEAKSLQSLQTTPGKQERTLVPESDSDSDEEKHGRREKRKMLASDSASSELSSPMCSTFLTPANKVIPESEDESSITPSPALKGGFPKTGNDTEVSSDSSKPDPLYFSIDSDTDVEDEEVEMTKAAPGLDSALTAEVDAVNPTDLHMNSDTDVEEEELEKAKSGTEISAAPAKQDSVNPAAATIDSNTDVEENEKTVTTMLSGPQAALEEKKEPGSSAQFHLESDTDAEDDDVPHIQDSVPPTSHVAEFNMNSDTDVEEDEETTNAIEPPSHSEADSKDLVNPAKSVDSVKDGKMLCHQSDSDTDVEDDVTEIRTPAVAEGTGNSRTRPGIRTADERITDAQHDIPAQVLPPAATAQDELRLDSDTDVEEDEEEMEENEEKCEEAAVKIIHSSTPRGAGLSEEELETQAFLSPSQLFKRPVLPSLLHPSVSPGGISHTDDDFAVAETQSFVCDAAQADAMLDETPQSLDGPESRRSDEASSFQLGLSDSSHRVPESEEHDREPAEEDWQLQATQLYAMKNSEGSTKTGQTQLDLDATQAYTDLIIQEEEDGEKEEEEEEETQPLAALGHSSTHTDETQLIKHRAQDEDNSDHDANEEVVASEPERKAKEDDNDEMQVDSHLSTADTLLIVRSPRHEEQTQPYAAQIQKAQEETEKEEHESSDQVVQETNKGERAQNERNENVQQQNEKEEASERKENEGMMIEKKKEVTRDVPEEEKKERDENKRVEIDNEVDEVRTQPAEAETIVGTQPMCEEEEGQEEEENKPRNSRRPGRRRPIETKQPVESDKVIRVTVAETQPMCEDEEGQEEEQLNESSSSRGPQPTRVESTQPLELDDHTHFAFAETQPMGEEEENKPRNSRRPSRRKQSAKVVSKQPGVSDKVTCMTIAETQPMCEEDEEGQEKEQQSEAISVKRSSTRRHDAKAKSEKLVESGVTIPETLPMREEEEAKPKSEARSVRKSRRGRQTAKIESIQPLEPDSTSEPMKMEEEKEEQEGRRSLRGKERGRAASGKGKGRGRAGAEKQKRGKVEQEDYSEEEVEVDVNKGRGRKNLKQKSKDDVKARLQLVEAENEETEHLKNQEEEGESKRLQREEKEEETPLERERKERDESTRLGNEREEREEREKRKQEEKDRLERERIEREKKEREEKEKKEREEMKRIEREKQLEKERREQEKKDRIERERMEKENKEKEKLEREMREREEKLEKGRKKQEVKESLAREKAEREEKEMRDEKEKQEKEMEQKEKEKESKDNKKAVKKEKRPAPDKRKTGLGRKGGERKKEEEQELEEGSKERMETEQELSEIQKQECEEGSRKKQDDKEAESEVKPRQGRRTARKSVAPPADVEDEGGPAKRTRSRSNSSNSVCSEQSTQDSLSEGRRRGGRRKNAEAVNERDRPSGRRTTTKTLSSEKEDIKPAAHSRSNSRSSDRSNSSVATQSQGTGGKRRKSVKPEEPEEEKEEGMEEQPTPVGRGRGRGRGGKRPGPNDIKVKATVKAEKEEAEAMATAEDSVTSQSSSRGRKRGADVSKLTAETPTPTPKTPRRSLAGQTHKVLFTGVVDEDGEKVLVRLGGGLAKGVGDMTLLVTDKVRRTVKFLCAMARGVPIVTPDWLNKCGKAGSFLSPNGFLVKDVEQEKRFNFSLQEALRVASSQPLLQGYEIHVTPSVKPEPAQMKEIITCCGARFLPKMPSAHKAQTVVVVSCEEDRALCERARSLSFPVVSAEFLLTGILQQKVDLQKHTLSLSPAAAVPKPAAAVPKPAAAVPKPAARSRGK